MRRVENGAAGERANPPPPPVRTLVAATALRSTLKYAVMRGTDKLITLANGDPIGLFDLRDDPGEQHDRCTSDAAQCAGLGSTLLAFAGGGPSATAPPQAAMVVDESVRQRLRALGYGGK